jgi:hypothetical protein
VHFNAGEIGNKNVTANNEGKTSIVQLESREEWKMFFRSHLLLWLTGKLLE